VTNFLRQWLKIRGDEESSSAQFGGQVPPVVGDAITMVMIVKATITIAGIVKAATIRAEFTK
jgi:hypothetical protein